MWPAEERGERSSVLSCHKCQGVILLNSALIYFYYYVVDFYISYFYFLLWILNIFRAPGAKWIMNKWQSISQAPHSTFPCVTSRSTLCGTFNVLWLISKGLISQLLMGGTPQTVDAKKRIKDWLVEVERPWSRKSATSPALAELWRLHCCALLCGGPQLCSRCLPANNRNCCSVVQDPRLTSPTATQPNYLHFR